MREITRRELLQAGLAVSSVAGLADSATARPDAPPSSENPVGSAKPLAAPAPRERLLFDFCWRFKPGHACDPRLDLDFGLSQDDFSKTGHFAFATGKFDDSAWRSLNLPHDWAVELPFVRDEGLQSHGYKPLGRKYPETSVGWYRRDFDIPASDADRRIVLEFDGALRDTLVFINGCFIGRNDNGYVPFSFDVTDFLQYGARNFIAVRVDASFGDGWFYEGAGIYRHVWLTKTAPLHLCRDESHVRAALEPGAARLSLGALVQNQSAQTQSPRVRWQIQDASGRTVATAETAPQSIASDGAATFTAVAKLPKPSLWSPETPFLYSALVTVEVAGTTHDQERVRFGVREIAFTADKGFFLNGRARKIQGNWGFSQEH